MAEFGGGGRGEVGIAKSYPPSEYAVGAGGGGLTRWGKEAQDKKGGQSFCGGGKESELPSINGERTEGEHCERTGGREEQQEVCGGKSHESRGKEEESERGGGGLGFREFKTGGDAPTKRLM